MEKIIKTTPNNKQQTKQDTPAMDRNKCCCDEPSNISTIIGMCFIPSLFLLAMFIVAIYLTATS